MSALTKLIAAGVAAALISAPAIALEANVKSSPRTEVAAQQDCRGWGVRCPVDVTPTYCIADDSCATALPGIALIRYDQRMDALLAQ